MMYIFIGDDLSNNFPIILLLVLYDVFYSIYAIFKTSYKLE